MYLLIWWSLGQLQPCPTSATPSLVPSHHPFLSLSYIHTQYHLFASSSAPFKTYFLLLPPQFSLWWHWTPQHPSLWSFAVAHLSLRPYVNFHTAVFSSHKHSANLVCLSHYTDFFVSYLKWPLWTQSSKIISDFYEKACVLSSAEFLPASFSAWKYALVFHGEFRL